MSVTNQPGPGRRSKSSANTNRLPSTRERRPALAGLAVLLIAGGAVLAGWLALREGSTQEYWVVSDDVVAGDRIQAGDLTPENFPDNGRFVPSSDRSVVGQYATTNLVEGGPLLSGTYAHQPATQKGTGVVPMNLNTSQVSPSIVPGTWVLVAIRDSQDTSGEGKSGVGIVRSVAPQEDGSLAIGVMVPYDCADTVAVNSQQGLVSLTELPPGKLTCGGIPGGDKGTGSGPVQ